MRYWKLIIKSPSGQLWTPPGFGSVLADASYTSFVNGQTLTAAWDVTLDIPVAAFSSPDSAGAIVQIKGVSLAEIAQANNLLGYSIQVFGGMQKGLPLANPSQAGLLVNGQIYQSFGNWIGNEMTLDFVILPGPIPQSQPANLVFTMKAGTPMATALGNALKTAFPNASPAPTININSSLVAQQDIVGVYGDITTLAHFINRASKNILSGSIANYPGVTITPVGNSFVVNDRTASSSASQPTQLQFQDLIGQPTWIEYPAIQIKTVMRADIHQGNQIKLPQGILTTTTAPGANVAAAPQGSQRNNAVFQGSFTVTNVHHFGQSRQQDAAAWCTVINAVPQPTGSS